MHDVILGEEPLTKEHKDQLHHLLQEGVECLGGVVELPEDTKDPGPIVEALKNFIDATRKGAPLPSPYEKPGVAAYGLGTLYGSVIQRAMDWQWIRLCLRDGTETSAIATRDRSHTVLPHQYFFRLLRHAEVDNTVAMLFEMIRDKNLPPSEAGGLAILS